RSVCSASWVALKGSGGPGGWPGRLTQASPAVALIGSFCASPRAMHEGRVVGRAPEVRCHHGAGAESAGLADSRASSAAAARAIARVGSLRGGVIFSTVGLWAAVGLGAGVCLWLAVIYLALLCDLLALCLLAF